MSENIKSSPFEFDTDKRFFACVRMGDNYAVAMNVDGREELEQMYHAMSMSFLENMMKHDISFEEAKEDIQFLVDGAIAMVGKEIKKGEGADGKATKVLAFDKGEAE